MLFNSTLEIMPEVDKDYLKLLADLEKSEASARANEGGKKAEEPAKTKRQEKIQPREGEIFGWTDLDYARHREWVDESGRLTAAGEKELKQRKVDEENLGSVKSVRADLSKTKVSRAGQSREGSENPYHEINELLRREYDFRGVFNLKKGRKKDDGEYILELTLEKGTKIFGGTINFIKKELERYFG